MHVLLLVASFGCHVVLAQATDSQSVSAEKLAAIQELMAVTGAEANAAQFAGTFAQQILSVLRARYPELPQTTAEIVTGEVRLVVEEELATGTLQARIYPIYARHFSLEEIRGLIEFNRSSVGQKANQVMPLLLRESVAAAQEWSENLGPVLSGRVIERLRQEGIEVRTEPTSTTGSAGQR